MPPIALPEHAVLIALGAIAGGFVSGLSGFGMALATGGIWLHAVEPMLSTTLTLVCSITAQLQTFHAVARDIQWRRILPFIAPGLAGVPVGVWIAAIADPRVFQLGMAGFLIVFPTLMLALRGRQPMLWGGAVADGAAGFVGGVLGGIAGLSGAPITFWASLRGWTKDQKRGVFQSYNLTILSASLLGHIVAGRLSWTLLSLLAVALPGIFIGVWGGITVYHRLDDRNFTDVVMCLLIISGVSLMARLF